MKIFQIISICIISTLVNIGEGSKTFDAIDENDEDYQGTFFKIKNLIDFTLLSVMSYES